MKIFLGMSGLFLFFIFSCSPIKKTSDIQVSLDDILENMKSNYEKINSYSADGNLELNLRNLRTALKFSIQTTKPSAAVIDLYGPFGLDVASIYLNGDSVFIYNIISSQVLKTSFSSPRFRNIQFFSTLKEVIYNLMFGYFDINTFAADSTKYSETKNKICVSKFLNQYRFDFCYDKSKMFISEVFYNKISTNESFEIYFSELKEFDKIIFPVKIFFNDSSTQESMSISFKKIKFNSIQGDIEFSIPDQVEVISW